MVHIDDYCERFKSPSDIEKEYKLIKNSEIVSTDVMAKALGITTQRVLQLVKEGVLFKDDRNSFNLVLNTRNYVIFNRRLVLSKALGLDK